MPTDTLYALTAAASDATAVRRVFEIKGREQGRPLPLFVSGLAMARAHRPSVNDMASRLAAQFWPGQLTIVVPKHKTTIPKRWQAAQPWVCVCRTTP